MVRIVLSCIFSLVVAFTAAQTNHLPSFVRKCSKKDFEQCVLSQQKDVFSHVAYGNKQYQIPSLVPFHIDKLTIQTPELLINLSNVNIHGLNNTQLTSYKHNFDTLFLTVTMFTNNMVIDADGALKGRISILNIEGKGRIHLVLNGVKTKADMQLYLKKMKNGLEYARIKNMTSSYTIQNLSTRLDNMFPSKDLNMQLNKILNDNWQEFNEVIRQDVTNIVTKTSSKILNNIMKTVPYYETFEE